mmetsp:Transcript_20614/g.19593  ORF Transcript_20614/g.19593 Transcript_20614/m.19593 type:complete len:149 (+) Transcript_20614:346-792(+)
MHLQTEFSEFLECADPYEFLSTYNKFTIDPKAKETFKVVAPPADLVNLCEDIRVLGKGDLHTLLKYRYKHNLWKQKQLKSQKEEGKSQREEEKGEEQDIDEQIDRELEESIKRHEKDRKKLAKKEKVKQQKSSLRQKMSVIASSEVVD